MASLLISIHPPIIQQYMLCAVDNDEILYYAENCVDPHSFQEAWTVLIKALETGDISDAKNAMKLFWVLRLICVALQTFY